jgi:CAAX protease family protein
VTHRSGSLVGWAGGPCAVLAAFFLLGALAPSADVRARVIVALVGAGLVFVAVRALRAGLHLDSNGVVVRSVFWSRRIDARDVAGLAIEPVLGRRWASLAVVTRTGEVVATAYASWRMATPQLQDAVSRVTRDFARMLPVDDAASALETRRRLEHAAAFTVMVDDGRLVAVPAATHDPGLNADTVEPASGDNARLLGWETVVVVVAFALPAVIEAVVILARHVARVSNLDEFALPLKHNPAGSLVLMLLLYSASAVVTPVALVLLARGGVWPRDLGLSLRGVRDDALPSVGLLGGVWLANFAVALILLPILNDKSLTNTASNSHVPAYFVIYAVFVSAVTAINEEVVVNGYLMTRLAQRGWRPWPSLWLSLAVRTSYHAYYGVALLATVPFGYLVTRSFQRHRRLGRPIITHFLFDAILLSTAVLTS